MAVKTHKVQNSFQLGEIDESFADRLDSEFVTTGVREMINWMPSQSGSAFRRPGIDRVSDWGDLPYGGLPDNEYRFVPMTLLNGRTDIIAVRLDLAANPNSQYEFYRVNTATGAVNSVGNINVIGLCTDPIPSWTQAGQSLFFGFPFSDAGIGASAPVRIVNTVDDTLVFESSLPWQRELRGLWTFDSVDNPSQIFSPVDTGSRAGDEGLSGLTQLDIGGNLYTVASVVYDTVPDPAVWRINLTAPVTTTSFADSRVYVRLPTAGEFFDSVPRARVVSFFQQRMVLAGIDSNIAGGSDYTKVLMSEPGRIFNILPGNNFDDSAIDVDVFLPEVSAYIWALSDQRSLHLASEAGIASAVSPLETTPSTIAFGNSHSRGGQLGVPPTKDDDRFLYIPKGQGSVHVLQFNENVQAFSSQNLYKLGPQTGVAVDQIVVRQPDTRDNVKRIIARFANGTGLLVGSEVVSDVVSWSRITLAAGRIAAVVAIDNEIWVYVSNPSNPNQYAFAKLDFSDKTANFVMDHKQSATRTGDSQWQVSDTALHNKTVFVVVDGVGKGYATTDGSGNFTTPLDGTTCECGLVFDSSISLFDVVVADEKGPSQHRISSNVRNIVSVLNTRQLRVNDVPLFSTVPDTPGGERILRTQAEVKTELGWDRTHPLVLTNQDAYNAHILSVSRELVI